MLSLSHIKRYVDLGFVVHPLCPPDHYCQSPGKIPYMPGDGHMQGWQHHEQFSADQWAEWLDYESEINVGFLTGQPSGLICLDIDNEEGKALIEQLGIEQNTWQYRTGRGLRLLYRRDGSCPTGLISKGNASVEVLGDGRQSVLPPSIHPNGRQYEWVVDRSPKTCTCSDNTLWVEHIGGVGGGELDDLNSEETDWSSILKQTPVKGERNTRLTSIAGHLMSPSGGMSEGEAAYWLSLYNNSLPEPLGEGELVAVVRSVFRAEQRSIQSGEREIRRIMIERCVSHSDAKMIWENME